MRTPTTHENFSREEIVIRGSERSFAIVIAGALGLLMLLNWWHDGKGWPWLGGVAVLFFAAGYICPAVLKPLNWLWFEFGLLLHSIVNPIVMAPIVLRCSVADRSHNAGVGKGPAPAQA